MTIPTLAELQQSILTDLENELGVNIPAFGKVFLRPLAYVQAAKLKIYYLAIANLQKNIFIDTADPEAVGGTLERFGRVKLNRNPFPAVAGQYDCEVTGEIGGVIPASTTFKSNDDSLNPGKLFVLDNQFTLTNVTDTINVRALEAGTESQLLVNDVLTATSPIANVNSQITVTLETVQPLAKEKTEAYRAAAEQAYRLEPQGGAPGDYRVWSSDAQGVAKVYPYAASANSNRGNVFVEATIVDSVDGKGTPSQSILDDVAEVIEFDPDNSQPIDERGRRPMTAWIETLPITVQNVDIDIPNFIGITPEIQNEITIALENELATVRPFVGGADVLADKNDILDVNKIVGVILQARPGSVFGTVTFQVDGNSVISYTFLGGNIPFLNSVTFS